MKYKKGDDIYLKGQITDVSSCSEASFPYEVNTADEFIDVREKDIVSVNEPEKPILIKEEAEWLEGLIKFVKSCGQSIYNTLYYITRQGYGYLFEYIDHDKDKSFILSNRIYPRELYPDDLKERFVNALLYGYEVEKEKLYTVKFSNEDFGKIYIGIFKAVNKFGISSLPFNDDDVKSWFTKDELERFKFWDNPAFEIKEVKK